MKNVDILKNVNNQKQKYVGIYVHIPFCSDDDDKYQKQYLKALFAEIESYKTKLKDCLVDTVFISAAKSNDIVIKVLKEIKTHFEVLKNAEITVEIFPEKISKNIIKDWFLDGINRITINVQSLKNKSLKAIEKDYTKIDFVDTVKGLQSGGIYNINADITIGLPYQKIKDIKKLLTLIKKLKLTHISAYSFEDDLIDYDISDFDVSYNYEERLKRSKIPKDESVLKMYDYILGRLTKNNYTRYQSQNFCLKGFESKHFLNLWGMKPYIGLGSNAHSFYGGKRYGNQPEAVDYINDIKLNGSAVVWEEVSNNQSLFEETLLLGLQTTQGVDIDKIKKELNIDLMESKKDIINKFIELGYLKLDKNFLSLTSKGFYISNSIITELII